MTEQWQNNANFDNWKTKKKGKRTTKRRTDRLKDEQTDRLKDGLKVILTSWLVWRILWIVGAPFGPKAFSLIPTEPEFPTLDMAFRITAPTIAVFWKTGKCYAVCTTSTRSMMRSIQIRAVSIWAFEWNTIFKHFSCSICIVRAQSHWKIDLDSI